MKAIEQSHNLWGICPNGFTKSLEWIERAGRVCYKSEDKITSGSAMPFVSKIMKSGHLSVIEHSMLVCSDSITRKFKVPPHMVSCPGRYLDYHALSGYHIGSFRSFYELLGATSLDHFIELIANYTVSNWNSIPFDLHRITVEFRTSRNTTHQLVRHRPASYSQESQRYVAYENGHINFIKPVWYGFSKEADLEWINTMTDCEDSYNRLRRLGRSPQAARVVLPNSTATTIIVTANLIEWRHIFSLRCSSAADPEIQALMKPVEEEFKKMGWI